MSRFLATVLSALISITAQAAKNPNTFELTFDADDLKRLSAPVQSDKAEVYKPTKAVGPVSFSDKGKETKRNPANQRQAGSEDLLSKEFVEFRNRITAVKSGHEFAAILHEYNSRYDLPATDEKYLPNDLKYVVARMSTMLPLRGLIWRMVELVHKIPVAQQILLGQVRNTTENILVRESSGYMEAQLEFFAMPFEGIRAPFSVEANFVKYMYEEVIPSLQTSINRLKALKMANVDAKGRQTPIVFDAKLRFGPDAFNEDYSALDRYKIVTDAERYAAIARLNRRIAVICENVAYNWNGYFTLVRQIGKRYGYELGVGQFFDSSPYIDGMTREERVKIAKDKRFASLWTKAPNGVGDSWMRKSLSHYRENVEYLEKAWDIIKVNNDSAYYTQIDPEMFQGRKDQIQTGMDNMKRMVKGPVTFVGAVTGKSLNVDFPGFFTNPPRDLKRLMPTGFAGNENVDKLKGLHSELRLKNGRDVFSMNIDGRPIEFRNYLYGRATRWDTGVEGYGKLFPGETDIAEARQILSETRGTRLLTNKIMVTVR